MAEMNKMSVWAVAVIALAVVTLMGIAIVAQYGLLLRTNTAVTDSTVTPVNNTATLFGSTGQYPFLQTLPSCFNASNVTQLLAVDTDYTISTGDADGGFITLSNADFDGEDINCTGTYLADTDAQGTADDFVTGLAIFGTFMAVIVLAIVGKIIIGLFGKGKK